MKKTGQRKVNRCDIPAIVLTIICALLCLESQQARAQQSLGTAFTYQGQIKKGGTPANGGFDMEFNLYDDADPLAGTLIGSLTKLDVQVSNGLFTVELDFGDVFPGDARWLEIGIRPTGPGPVTFLFPLQQLNPTPYSLYSLRSGLADNSVNSLSANNANMANNSDHLDGLDSGDFVQTRGGNIDGNLSVGGMIQADAFKLNGQIITAWPTSSIPPGTIVAYGSPNAPEGWLLCDGSEVSRTTYANLFAAIGTLWGDGNGMTTFELPDLRGRTPIGTGQGVGLASRAVAETGGEEEHTLTVNEMPAHSHEIRANDETPGPFVYLIHNLINAEHTQTRATEPAGGSQPHNVMQPYVVVNYIIKY